MSFVFGRTGHQLQGLRDFAVGEHIQKRRLPQGNVERRLQRVVEHRIARAVGKIGENDGVLGSDLGAWTAEMPVSSNGCACHDQSGGEPKIREGSTDAVDSVGATAGGSAGQATGAIKR